MAINRPTLGAVGVMAARYESKRHRQDRVGIGTFQRQGEKYQEAKARELHRQSCQQRWNCPVAKESWIKASEARESRLSPPFLDGNRPQASMQTSSRTKCIAPCQRMKMLGRIASGSTRSSRRMRRTRIRALATLPAGFSHSTNPLFGRGMRPGSENNVAFRGVFSARMREGQSWHQKSQPDT